MFFILHQPKHNSWAILWYSTVVISTYTQSVYTTKFNTDVKVGILKHRESILWHHEECYVRNILHLLAVIQKVRANNKQLDKE
jgi:hypothetical protein